jgi:hypothetical protein
VRRDFERATTTSAMATLKMDAIGRHPSSSNSEPALKPVQVSLSVYEDSTSSYAWKMLPNQSQGIL